MTSSITLAVLLSVGLLGVLLLARRLHGHTVGSDWLVSWSAVYLSSLLHLALESDPLLTGLALGVASLHPFFQFAGAKRLATGHVIPSLLALAVIFGSVRASLYVAGSEKASAVFFAPFALCLGLASAWMLWFRGEATAFHSNRLSRGLAVALVPYSLAYTVIVVAVPFGLHLTWVGIFWMALGLGICAGQFALAAAAARQSSRLLIDSNSRLSTLIESSSDFVAWADARGFVRYGNRALRELIGDEQAPTDDLESGIMVPRLTLEKLHTEAEGNRLRESILPIVEATGLWEGETILRSANGQEVPVSAVVLAERNAQGEVVAIGFLMRSLSHRLKAEKDLRTRYEFERFVSRLAADILGHPLPDSEKAIENAMNMIHERFEAHRSAIFVCDEEDQFEILFSEGDDAEHVAPSASSSPHTLELLRSGRAVQASAVPAKLAEEVVSLGITTPSAAIVPLLHDGELVGGLVMEFAVSREADDFETILRPISELLACAVSRRRAWRLMLKREDELRHAQRLEAVGQLAGGIAHDFNNSLTVISGYAEDLQKTPLSEDQTESLGQIAIASQRAASLTAQLLAFSRNQELVPQVFDLNERLRELQRMLRRVVGEQFNIRTELDVRTGAMICADPVQVDQVVTNLVINARDAMNSGGEVHISTEVGPSNVWLLVSDNGHGMDEETRRRAFEPFFTTKSAGMGTGLGLSTVYGVIKQSGGRVSVDSSPGAGTTVTISLPLVGALPKVKSEDSQELLAAEPPAPVSGERRVILLVEDEELVRRLTKRTLEQAGFSVLTASDGKEALETALTPGIEIDFILSDVVMPIMSGPEFIKTLRKEDRETPVLFMSGYPNHPSQELSLPDGAVLIEKPFTSSALLSRIGELLDGSAWAVQTGAHNLLAFRNRH